MKYQGAAVPPSLELRKFQFEGPKSSTKKKKETTPDESIPH